MRARPGCLEARGHPCPRRLAKKNPRVRREHALLFSIINAATDPILFTNMEGQLIIANARAEMLFTAAGRRERRAPARRAAEQHVLLRGAVAHRARRGRGRTPGTAARRPNRGIGPALRAAQHRRQRSARRHRRGVDSAEHHRPPDGDAADRRELRQAARRRSRSARRARSAEPAHRFGRRSHHRHGSGRRDLADEHPCRAPVYGGARVRRRRAAHRARERRALHVVRVGPAVDRLGDDAARDRARGPEHREARAGRGARRARCSPTSAS